MQNIEAITGRMYATPNESKIIDLKTGNVYELVEDNLYKFVKIDEELLSTVRLCSKEFPFTCCLVDGESWTFLKNSLLYSNEDLGRLDYPSSYFILDNF